MFDECLATLVCVETSCETLNVRHISMKSLSVLDLDNINARSDEHMLG